MKCIKAGDESQKDVVYARLKELGFSPLRGQGASLCFVDETEFAEAYSQLQTILSLTDSEVGELRRVTKQMRKQL